MAKTFWGSVATTSNIEATYEWTSVEGSITKVTRKDSALSTASDTASDDLVAAADHLQPDLTATDQSQGSSSKPAP